jgi:hypothetical protein
MIICAAIKLNMNNIAASELIVHGRRHGDCWNTIHNLNDNWKHATKTEGFVTHTGEFLDRWEAFEHARVCGQVSQTTKWKQEDEGITELYSEDLY